MPLYPHVQEAKKAQQLPMQPGEQIGVCLTCKYWQNEETRTQAAVNQLALCIYPQLKEYALIVSGSSGCNKWQEAQNNAPEAKEYASRGEEK